MKSSWLWGIVALALALRLALLAAACGNTPCLPGADMSLAPEGLTTPDSYHYDALAVRMVRHGVFGDETFRTPGYPAFLASAHVWGWKCTVVLQILMDCGLVVLTYLIGRRLLSHRAGLFGALFQAISPLAIASSCRILSDGLYAFLLAIVMLLLIRHFRLLRQDAERAGQRLDPQAPSKRIELSPGTWLALILAALALGAAAYVRPIGQMMAVPVALVLLCGKRGLIRSAAFAAVFIACLAPWTARNIVTQGYCGFSSFASESFANYVAARVLAEAREAKDEERNRPADLRFETRKDQRQAVGALNRAALRHPLLVAKYQLKGTPIFWLPGATDVLEVAGLTHGNRGTLQVLFNDGLGSAIKSYFGPVVDDETLSVTILMVLTYLVWLLGLALCAAIYLPRIIKARLSMPAEAWIIILLVLLSMLATGPASHPRFRVPLEPYLSIAAAAGYVELIRLWTSGRSRGRIAGNPAH